MLDQCQKLSLYVKVLEGLAGIASAFKGAHMRLEADASEWTTILGGRNLVWNEYVTTMQLANFTAADNLYLANGLMTYQAGNNQMSSIVAGLTSLGLCRRVLYKEQFLDAAKLDRLHSEQKGLIDLLVLAKAKTFVGFKPSTFSFFVTQYRLLRGFSAESSMLVQADGIGTNALFDLAAVLANE